MKTHKKWRKRLPQIKTMAQLNPKLVEDVLTAIRTGDTAVIQSLADGYASYTMAGTPLMKYHHFDDCRRIFFNEQLSQPGVQYTQAFRPVKLVLFPLQPKDQKFCWLLCHWGISDDRLNELMLVLEDRILAMK